MGGASKYLANLPSRGLFTSTVPSSSLGVIRVYICDHETAPPDDQQIKTNTTNILIRSLQLNKQKGELKDSKSKSASASSRGKRAAEGTSDGRTHSKRANTASTSGGSKQGGPSACPSQKELQAFTVERLRALLKEKGLSAKGKKDELISRLKEDESK